MSEPSYDSRPDTLQHIGEVRGQLSLVIAQLALRSFVHDQSKLDEPEKSVFDRVTPKLKELTYGSDAYKAILAEMGEALKHHYEENAHHPEFYENGVDGMNLLDLIEMLCDWCAATKRHADGDLGKSLLVNRKRFGIGDQLFGILVATAIELEMLPADWEPADA